MNLETRIDNWKRWALGRNHYDVSCVSIECRYKSPQVWQTQAPAMPVDTKDALVVEKAVVGLPMPWKGVFVYYTLTPHINPFRVAKKLGIKRWYMDDVYGKAIHMVENRLDNRT